MGQPVRYGWAEKLLARIGGGDAVRYENKIAELATKSGPEYKFGPDQLK